MPHTQTWLLVGLCLALLPACERQESVTPDDGKRPEKFGSGVSFGEAEEDPARAAAVVVQFFEKFTSGEVEAAMDLCTPGLRLRVNDGEAVENGRAVVSRYLRNLPGSIGLSRVLVGEFGTVVAEGVRVKTSGGATGSGFVLTAEFEGDRISAMTMVTRTLDGQVDDLPPAPTLPERVTVIDEMSNDLNKAVAENLYRTWTHRNWDDLKRVTTEEVVWHDTAEGQKAAGFAALIAAFDGQAKAFPDLRFELKQSWAAGDFVVVEYEIGGTHTGTYGEIAATGASFQIPRVDVYRFADEVIVEMWSYYSPDLIRDRIREAQAPKTEPTQNDEADEDEDEDE